MARWPWDEKQIHRLNSKPKMLPSGLIFDMTWTSEVTVTRVTSDVGDPSTHYFWWFNNKTQIYEYHNIDQDWTLGCWRIGWFHRLLFSYIRHISKPLMSCCRSAWYWTHMAGCGYSFWYSFGIQLNWLSMMGWWCFQMLRIYLLV